MVDQEIEDEFPRLRTAGSFFVTSPKNPRYNCVAWGARDVTRIWQYLPGLAGYYWPEELTTDETLESWIRVFEIEGGFSQCSERSLEPGIEKIAIYIDARGEPTHVSRQMASGLWTSKLGYRGKDIVHRKLEYLEGGIYGTVAQIMQRSAKAQDAAELAAIFAP
jgi:hypothetical protein